MGYSSDSKFKFFEYLKTFNIIKSLYRLALIYIYIYRFLNLYVYTDTTLDELEVI